MWKTYKTDMLMEAMKACAQKFAVQRGMSQYGKHMPLAGALKKRIRSLPEQIQVGPLGKINTVRIFVAPFLPVMLDTVLNSTFTSLDGT